MHGLALEPADAGHNPDAAVVDPVEQQVVDRDGAAGKGACLGGWQAWVVGVLSDRYAGQQAVDEVLFLRAELLEEGDLLTGAPEVSLRLEEDALVYDDV
jgi:hypothetical protein